MATLNLFTILIHNASILLQLNKWPEERPGQQPGAKKRVKCYMVSNTVKGPFLIQAYLFFYKKEDSIFRTIFNLLEQNVEMIRGLHGTASI